MSRPEARRPAFERGAIGAMLLAAVVTVASAARGQEPQAQPVIESVTISGNAHLAEPAIRDALMLHAGAPLDRVTLDRAVRVVKDLYRRQQFFLAEVTVDKAALDTNRLVLRIREGPQARSTAVGIAGAGQVTEARLRAELKGDLGLDRDLDAVRRLYRRLGYLDATVERTVMYDATLAHADIRIRVREGPRYMIERVRIVGIDGPLARRLHALPELAPGQPAAEDLPERIGEAVGRALGDAGHLGADVRVEVAPAGPAAVAVVVRADPGPISTTGSITVRGNELTREDVIRRRLALEPGAILRRSDVERSRRRLEASGLFERSSVEALAPGPAEPSRRDVLVEVEEQESRSFRLGLAANSDQGLMLGAQFEERNFDWTRWPRDVRELLDGRAFRGGGQRLRLFATPGTEQNHYQLTFAEPWALGGDAALSVPIRYSARWRESHEETRYGGRLYLSWPAAEGWLVTIGSRLETVRIDRLDDDAPIDVRRSAGRHDLLGLSFAATRSTVDDRYRPASGARQSLAVELVRGLDAGFSFARITADLDVFLPVSEDYLGRRSRLSMRGRLGWQVGDETPIYERLYLGGRSLRGFRHRTVSPRQDGSSDPVGGDWLLAGRVQYDFPIMWPSLDGVLFADAGTVLDDPGVDDVRVSVGAGLRVYLPRLGRAPLAFDFATPILSDREDEERLFSFTVALPF